MADCTPCDGPPNLQDQHHLPLTERELGPDHKLQTYCLAFTRNSLSRYLDGPFSNHRTREGLLGTWKRFHLARLSSETNASSRTCLGRSMSQFDDLLRITLSEPRVRDSRVQIHASWSRASGITQPAQ
eukprot:653302-Rhodomonas_salina.2